MRGSVLDAVEGGGEALGLHVLGNLDEDVLAGLGHFDHGEEEAEVGMLVPFVGVGSARHDEGGKGESASEARDQEICVVEDG